MHKNRSVKPSKEVFLRSNIILFIFVFCFEENFKKDYRFHLTSKPSENYFLKFEFFLGRQPPLWRSPIPADLPSLLILIFFWKIASESTPGTGWPPALWIYLFIYYIKIYFIFLYFLEDSHRNNSRHRWTPKPSEFFNFFNFF